MFLKSKLSKQKLTSPHQWQRTTQFTTVSLIAVIGTAFILLTHAATAYGPITGIGGKCLDNYANRARNSNKIELWTCNGEARQNWSFASSSGTITNPNGYCLDVAGDSTAVGTKVQLYTCNGTRAQIWSVNATAGTISSPQSGLCLDDQWASTANGTQIWMYTCNGTAAQNWKVTSSSAAPTITSGSSTTFTEGTAGSFTVTDTGNPTPSLSESGSLPSGILFDASTGVLHGTATVSGTYTFTITASNGVSPNSSQTFTLTANPPASSGGGTTGTSGGTGGGGTTSSGGSSGSSCSSPYTNSVFCKTTAGGTPPNSGNWTADVVNSIKVYGDMNVAKMPIIPVAAGQTMRTVSFNTASCPSWAGSFGTVTAPIPPNVTGGGGTDNEVIIYQPSSGTEWSFWIFGGTGPYTACAAGNHAGITTSSGIGNVSDPYIDAADFTQLGTTVTQSDVQQGSINHAIAINLQFCGSGSLAPANRGEGNCQDAAAGPPMGAWFKFPTSTNCSNSNYTQLAQLVCQAGKTYGFVVDDFAGGANMIFQSAPTSGTDYVGNAEGGQQDYQAITPLPWSTLMPVNPPQ